MMTIKKPFLTLACLMAVTVAHAATGHIWSIMPGVTADGSRTPVEGPVSSIEKPLRAGDTASFIIRLASVVAGDTDGKWYPYYVGPGSKWVWGDLKIGIYVNGELCDAELDSYYWSGAACDYTDLIFKYVVKSGDFELPITLAMADGSRATGEFREVAYYVNPLSATLYEIRNARGETANLWFGSWDHVPEGAGKQVKDLDLRNAGFYVKTVDFDSNWEVEPKTESEDDPGLWRSVHEGSTETVGVDPSLVLDSAPSNSVTLHVWSDNGAAVRVTGGEREYDVVMNLDKAGTLATNRVIDVKILAGQPTVQFEIYGVASNKTANLYLSSNTNYTYKVGTSDRLIDYVTVPVKCVGRLPANVSVALDGDDPLVVNVGTNYEDVVGTMTVKASTGWTNTLTVTVTPRLLDATATDGWSNYLHVAEKKTAGKWASTSPCTVTFTAAELANSTTSRKTIYLWAMGADEHTSALDRGLAFDVSIDTESGTYYKTVSCDSVVRLVPTKPVIASPKEKEALTANGNVKREFDIVVNDSYKNLTDRATGYRVYLKRESKEKSVTELPDAYAPDGDGILCKLNSDGSLGSEKPGITYYTPGTFDTQIYLLAPDGKTKSETRTVSVTVSEPASITPHTNLNDANVTNEGALVTVYVTLSEKNSTGKAIYAFLKPVDEDSTNKVSSTCLTSTAKSKGLKIGIGKDASAAGTLLLLDGRSEALGGTALEYELVLCYSSSYDETKLVEGFESENLAFTVMNVAPTVNEVRMDNVESVTASGETMPGVVSKGASKTFTFDVEEPGQADLSATGEEAFQLRYSIKEAGGMSTNAILRGNANTNSFTYAFRSVGTAVVSVELMDKDMKEYPGKFGGKFTFNVLVTDQPRVSIESESGAFDFYENRLGVRNTKMTVRLTKNPSSDELEFAVAVTPKFTDASNPGTLKLGGFDYVTTTNANVYVVKFSPGQTEASFYVEEGDGTALTESKGYTLQARCITDTESPDRQPWSSVFVPESAVYLSLANAKPTVTTDLGEENTATNAFVAAIGDYDSPVGYTVDDIDFDLGREGSTTNLTVTWYSEGTGAVSTNVNSSTNTFYFTPNFKSSGNGKIVYVTVSDKDGGKTQKKWYFDVQSSKTLVAYPVGPSAGTTSLADRYQSLLGCGEGHVYVSSATAAGTDFFRQNWNCSLANDAEAYAWGYKVGAVDDGTLDGGYDVAIDPNGKSTTGSTHYRYPDPSRDSFLYLWIKYGSSESTTSSGGSSSTTSADEAQVAKIAMETWNGASISKSGAYSPSLPKEADENGTYSKTYVEAVFSKEYLPSDNMGDINFDGLPDLYVKYYKFDVFDAESGELTGDDTVSLAEYNDDADYLPGKASGVYSYFVPASTNTAALSGGTPFTAVQELRGGYQESDQNPNETYWSALNDACSSRFVNVRGVTVDRVYEDPATCPTSTLTRLEWAAYVKLGKPGVDNWTPECPTDPTLWDSDEDNLSDGYEYYYWYRAHVGYWENENTHSHAFMTGRRFNPADPTGFTVITSEEIERVMNPQLNANHAETDSDNDGLSDLEESALGTNPFDFDTDGDGLPDGYEVVLSQTDPLKYTTGNGDALKNPDGDVMAFNYVEGRFKVYGFLTDGGTVVYRAFDRHALGNEGYLPVTVFETNGVSRIGWKVLVGGAGSTNGVYFTTSAPSYRTGDDGTVRLTADLLSTTTCVLDEDAETHALYLGLPAFLPRGTVLVAEPESDQEVQVRAIALVKSDGTLVTNGVVEIRETLPPTRPHSAFRYGDLAFARDSEKPEYGLFTICGDATLDCGWPVVYDSEKDQAIREDIRKKLPVYLIHHVSYQMDGFDPRTAFKAGNSRSRAFNTYDEFLALAFHIHVNARSDADGLLDGDVVPTLDRPWSTIWSESLTDPLKADTDDDGMPDGWELYVMSGPQTILPKKDLVKLDDKIPCLAAPAPTSIYGPLTPYGSASDSNAPSEDADGLSVIQEFCAVDSLAAYPNEATIQGSLQATAYLASGWRNKTLPTDPWNEDTDGDGLNDGEEGKNFVYGDADGSGVPGGGLNPCSWDTDKDGLPDPFEVEFAGTYSGGWRNDGMDGTVNDANLDYDQDGLLNWQEYLVGTIRAWRYDDTFSSWTRQSFSDQELMEAMSSDEAWGRYWYERLVCEPDFYGRGKAVVTENPADGSYEYNPRLVNDIFDAGANYFSLCTNEWDQASGNWYYFRDGVYHDLKNPGPEWLYVKGTTKYQYNRYSWWAKLREPMTGYPFKYTAGGEVMYIYPEKYICCDPTKYDTDNDGMDDYYELFHGLNPLLGQSGNHDNGHRPPIDVVYVAYGGGALVTVAGGEAVPIWSAENNFWLNAVSPNNESDTGARLNRDPVSKNGSTYDFVAYPWLGGLAYADVDGDNVRNQEEAIMPNLQSASSWHHTDPTPLWLTDFSYANSLTYRYYRPVSAVGWQIKPENNIPYFSYDVNGDGEIDPATEIWDFRSFPGYSWSSDSGVSIIAYTLHEAWGPSKAIWSFEENEGYDSDHDYLSDFEEAQGKTKSASDPQDSDSPLRRQAMWFDGRNSFLQSPIAQSEIAPDDSVPTGVDMPFLYFTVECWARPDNACDLKKAQTLVERAIWTGNANAADEKWLRKNFLIGIRDGKWYAKYDSSGTDALQPVEVANGPLATTNWTHVAATFDGTALRLYVNGVCTEGWTQSSSLAPAHGTWSATINEAGELREGKTTYEYSSFLVGASALDMKGVIFDYQYRLNPLDATTKDDYENFFHGYIDEVRIWDGARDKDEIMGAMRTRYTSTECAANRTACYEAWLKNASFAAGVTGTAATRPAELRAHYTFDHLPGATQADWVLPVPSGFSTDPDVTDARAKHWSRPDGYVCPWWNSVNATIASSVYTDRAWIPWIGNTIAHLPRPDGTTLDSFYWSRDFAATNSASSYGYDSFDFPMTAEYVSKWTQMGYTVLKQPPNTTPTRYEFVKGNADLLKSYAFTIRHRDSEGYDLLPFGGAYPKRITGAEGGMWDDQGAADAWAQMGADAGDTNNDGLPDWWTQYALENYNASEDPTATIVWDTIVNYYGVRMKAGQAYLRDLAKGMLPDAEYHAEDLGLEDTRDLDNDGMKDWWEEIHLGVNQTHTIADRDADPDYDGLSNYSEYRLNDKGLMSPATNLQLQLDKDFSNGNVYDYFRTNGLAGADRRYAGFVATDHDLIEDSFETEPERKVYSTHLDPEGNGWSKWSEARALHNENTWQLVGYKTVLTTVEFDKGSDELNFFAATNTGDIIMREYKQMYDGSYYQETVDGESDTGTLVEYKAGDWVSENDYDWADWCWTAVRYTIQTEEPIMEYGGKPTPRVNLTLWGNLEEQYYESTEVENAGTTNETTNVVWRSHSVYVEAYRGHDLSEAYWWGYVGDIEEENGKMTVSIDGEGLEEGLNTFVVRNGDIYGFATANVGYDHVDLEIGLEERSAVIPSGIYSWGDRTVIRRIAINGYECQTRPVWAGDVDGYVTAAAILQNFENGAIDLDAKYLVKDAETLGFAADEIRSATYEVLRTYSYEDDETSTLESYSYAWQTFDKEFSLARPVATPVSPTATTDNRVKTHKPVFKFAGLDGCTAFVLEIATNADDKAVILAATNILPAAWTSAGKSVREFKSDFQIGEGLDLSDKTNYFWRVCGMSAKWPTAGKWSAWASFQTAVESTDGATGYGKLAAEVRYYGAATNDTSDVIVGVFTDVAFAGKPVASAHLKSGSFADLAVEKKAESYFDAVPQIAFDGLEPGDYYVMAFNDRNRNGQRDAYESWGYLNKVGQQVEDRFTPVALTVEANMGSAVVSGVLFLEDTDTNDNGRPDCIEDEDRLVTSVKAESVDGDGDGLDVSDDYWNEYLWGTDPEEWDTDGDGFPDGYEVWAGIDPFDAWELRIPYTYTDTNGVEQTYYYWLAAAQYAVDGDVMAYAMITRKVLYVENAVDGAAWVIVDPSDTTDYRVNGKLNAGGRTEFDTVYTYGVLPAADWNDYTEKTYYGRGGTHYATGNDVVKGIYEKFEIMLVHADVYNEFGFESGVATPGDSVVRSDGQVHTRPMYGIDKYLVSVWTGYETSMNAERRWGQKLTCLKPGVSDYDGDGIPDGWELYMMFPGAKSGIYTPAMSPWKAYDGYTLKTRDLDGYLVTNMVWTGLGYFAADGRRYTAGSATWTPADWYNNGNWTASPYVENDGSTFFPGTDVDNETARRYNIEAATNRTADVDSDGLSNWQEYLAAKNGDVPLATNIDVRVAISDNAVLDYFRTNGETGIRRRYLGELVADHDFIEDWFEDLYDDEAISRDRYDAHVDADSDGWSNWSEARSGTDPSRATLLSLVKADGSEDHVMQSRPTPTIYAKIGYNGVSPLTSTVIVKAWNGDIAAGLPDAIWRIPGSGETSEWNTRFLGLAPNVAMNFNIGPGDVSQHHVMLEFYDPNYYIEHVTIKTNGEETTVLERHNVDSSDWGVFYYGDRPTDTTFGRDTGTIAYYPGSDVYGTGDDGTETVAGDNVDDSWVNYKNGDIRIDFTSDLLRQTDATRTFIEVGSGEVKVIYHTYHYNFTRAFWRVRWMGRMTATDSLRTVSLSEPEEFSEESFGRLVEGRTTFVAFADTNNNGVWDEGEPFGYKKGVEVGFDKVPELAIELTDSAPAAGRFDVSGLPSDTTLRLVRTAINGEPCTERLVWSGRVGDRSFLSEADWLREANGYILDSAVATDIAKNRIASLESVTYTLMDTSNALNSVTKKFSANRMSPMPVSPSATSGSRVRTAQLTFTFVGDNANYTAFQIQVADAAKNVIWSSPTNVFPAATSDGCRYTAPLYVGQGQVLADGSSYFWRVQQMNAKFPASSDDADWSAWTPFTTAVDSSDGDTGYGALAADVRYYGAATNGLSKVIVGVYETADFTGDPVAKATLTGEGTVQDLARTGTSAADFMNPVANVSFDGVSTGAKYVMAFIDLNGNGARDKWEPWGYLNNVATGSSALYTPMALVVKSTKTETPSAIVFIEDTDVNDNGTPDCIDGIEGGIEFEKVSDLDGDGIPDSVEETEYGTDPYSSDTDGDGMPDGWELSFAGTDPLAQDGDLCRSDDVMAYAEVERVLLTVSGDGGATVSYYLLDEGEVSAVPQNGADVQGLSAFETYWYGEIYGQGLRTEIPAGMKVCEDPQTVTVALVHAQVYEEYGFDSLTAVDATDAVNTKPFAALDKYLVVRYLDALGLIGYDGTKYLSGEDMVNRTGAWADYSLKPSAQSVDSSDCDRDGVPDGWELYVMFGPSAGLSGGATRGQMQISPWNSADARAVSPGDAGLADGMQCKVIDEIGYDAETGTYHPTDPWTSDTDGDTVLDCYYHTYCLWDPTGDRDRDVNGNSRPDGLSNYAEYLITEVFKLAKCDPNTYATADLSGDVVCDYYKKVGELYLGEMFTDHDRVADAWERTYPNHASASVYDPARDDDGDGWSNWAEAQAGTDPTTAGSVDYDGVLLPQYPVPVIRLNVVYNGRQLLLDNLYVKAWSEAKDPDMTGSPDAVWRISSLVSSDGSSEDGDGTQATVEATTGSKMLGVKPDRMRTYNLGIGTVTQGSFKMYFKNTTYAEGKVKDGAFTETGKGAGSAAKWYLGAYDNAVSSASGEIRSFYGDSKVGTIDYATGTVEIDFAAPELSGTMLGSSGNCIDSSGSGATTNVTGSVVSFDLATAHVQLQWQSTVGQMNLGGTYYLTDAFAPSSVSDANLALMSLGHVREGKASFIAYVGDENGNYVPGNPLGVVRGVDIGWSGAEGTVQLGDTTGVTPRFDIWDSATSDRGSTIAEMTQTMLTDRLGDPDATLSNRIVGVVEPSADKVRLRFVRMGINGVYAYALGRGMPCEGYDPLVFERWYDRNGRSFLCEADFLRDGEFDLDWDDLQSKICDYYGVKDGVGDVTNMTYLAVLDGGEGNEYWFRGSPNYDTNTIIRALATTIERRFERTKHPPVAAAVDGICYGARPTFRWTLPNEESGAKVFGTTYTAFNLEVYEREDDGTPGEKIYSSGLRRAPAQDADGVFSWTADLSVGDLTKELGILLKSGNYLWRVAMYNAKFKPGSNDQWSAYQAFSTAVNSQQPVNASGYSAIDVSVKYAGPDKVIYNYDLLAGLKKKIRVQAFATADFAGEPLSEAVVTEGVTEFNDPSANVRLVGLPATGTYYLRAYVDSNGNHALDDWESWGAATEPVTLATTLVTPPVAGIWIEDSDTDGDWIPDALEYATYKDLTTEAPNVMENDKTIFSTARKTAAVNDLASVSTTLEGATLTIFENGSWAKILLGWKSETGEITLDEIREAVRQELSVKANTVRITSMTITGNLLTLWMDAEVTAASVGSELLSRVYTVEKTKTVQVRILKKDSLAQADWVQVGEDHTVTFGGGEQSKTVTILEKLDSAFYKVEIVE